MMISEVKAAVDLTKDIISAIKAAKNYDPVILDNLDKLREKILDAQVAEMELREKIAEMEKKLELKKKLFDQESGAFFDPADTNRERPFCARCLQEKQIESNLVYDEMGSQCRICKEIYRNAAQKRAEQERIDRFKEARNGVRLVAPKNVHRDE